MALISGFSREFVFCWPLIKRFQGMPRWSYVKYSRYASVVLSEVLTPCRFGRRSLPLRANVRVGPPAMSSFARSFSPTAFLHLKKPSFNQKHHRGRQRGRFFRAKAQKKIAPDGRPKRVSMTAGMPTQPDDRPKRVFIEK